MIHIGNKIKETLKEQGRTVTWLAQQLCCDRSNIYKVFSKENIDIKQLDRISAILGVDFFIHFRLKKQRIVSLVCAQLRLESENYLDTQR